MMNIESLKAKVDNNHVKEVGIYDNRIQLVCRPSKDKVYKIVHSAIESATDGLYYDVMLGEHYLKVFFIRELAGLDAPVGLEMGDVLEEFIRGMEVEGCDGWIMVQEEYDKVKDIHIEGLGNSVHVVDRLIGLVGGMVDEAGVNE